MANARARAAPVSLTGAPPRAQRERLLQGEEAPDDHDPDVLAAIKCARSARLGDRAASLSCSLGADARRSELFALSGRSELEFDMGDQLNEFLEEFRKASSAKSDMKKAAQAAAAVSAPGTRRRSQWRPTSRRTARPRRRADDDGDQARTRPRQPPRTASRSPRIWTRNRAKADAFHMSRARAPGRDLQSFPVPRSARARHGIREGARSACPSPSPGRRGETGTSGKAAAPPRIAP